MPKGKRYRLTKGNLKLDLSQGQFELLAKKSFKVKEPMHWNLFQRVAGLVSNRLFVKRNGGYQRTNKGAEIYNDLVAKS